MIIDDCFTPNKTFSEFRAGRHSVTIEHVLNVDAVVPEPNPATRHARGASGWQCSCIGPRSCFPQLLKNLSGFGSVYSCIRAARSMFNEPACFADGLESPFGRSLYITETQKVQRCTSILSCYRACSSPGSSLGTTTPWPRWPPSSKPVTHPFLSRRANTALPPPDGSPSSAGESSQLGHRDVMRDEANVLFGDGTNHEWVGLCR